MPRQPFRRLGPSEIKAAAAEFIRQDLRDALALRVVTEYRGSKFLSEATFEQAERHDLHAKIRRGRIEGAIRAAARGCVGVTAETAWNAAKSSYYTRLRSGPFVLTQSAVEFREDVPRDAVFRSTLASGQLDLFGSSEDANEDGDVILGILLHGRRSMSLLAPTFLMIGFPEADCSRYVTTIGLEDELARAIAIVLGGGSQPEAPSAEQPPGPPGPPSGPLGEEQVNDDLPLHFREAAKDDKKAGGDDGA